MAHGWRIALIFCGLIASGHAMADWQWTRWGMSIDEVIAGSNGAVSFSKLEKDKDARARGTYSTLGFTFDAHMMFRGKDGGLSLVELTMIDPTSGKCFELQRAMFDVYGQSFEKGGIALIQLKTATWLDEKTKNRVMFLISQNPDRCSLQYQPMVEKSKSGL